jgi:hypothetical protein
VKTERITLREWVVCFFVFLSVIFLFSVSSPVEERVFLDCARGEELKEKVKVGISGAVLNPGEYEVGAGASLKKVLDEAGFTSFADRKALYSKKTILNSCEVFVPDKNTAKKVKRR